MKEFDRSGGIPGQAPWENDWKEYEEQHLGRPERAKDDVLQAPVYKPNKLNHFRNLHGGPGLGGLTGRWKGTVYLNGVARTRKV